MSEPSLIQDIFAELKPWQTGLGALLGAVLGFLSLAFAALYNFKLNRRRDRELRETETRSVAAAIYGEIIPLRDELAQMAKKVADSERLHGGLRKHPGFRSDVYRLSEPVIFPRLAEKFGLLKPDLAFSISKFYSNLEIATKNLEVLVAPQERPRSSCTIFLRPAVSGVKEIQPTLGKIQNMLGMPNIEEPDIGYAEAIIEVEEEIPSYQSS